MSSAGASPSTEGVSLDPFREMMNSLDGFPSSSTELWDAIANIESDDFCWRDVLA